MSDANVQVGTLKKLADGRIEGRLQHSYAGHRAAELWAMLTEPAKIALWIAPGKIELKPGGNVQIDFQDSGFAIKSTVTDIDIGRLLTFSWSSGNEPARPLRWEISEADGSATMALTVTTPAGEDAAKACAGFEAHLEMLGAALEGVPMKFPFNLFVAARKAYSEQLA